MRQVLFTIPIFGGIKVFGYGTMLFLAFLGVDEPRRLACASREAGPRGGLRPRALGVPGGADRRRLFYVIQYWGDRVRSVADIFRIWEGGIVLYGSIMGGTAAFFLYRMAALSRYGRISTSSRPSLALGIALGRFGCFLNGCCYGDRCDDLPWAISFPAVLAPLVGTGRLRCDHAPGPWSLPVHPTQLYSAIDGLILLLLLSAYYPLRRRDGEVMALLMVTYPVTRFLIEYLRNDEGVLLAGLTISQNISVLLLVAGLAFWFVLSRSPTRRDVARPGRSLRGRGLT